MELRVLQYFLTVVQEENISRAADVLHITQPTLSRQMAQLENEIGTPLFIRGRHLELTDAGVMLRRRAEEVVALMDKIENEFENQEEIGGVISIGSGGLNASQMLPAAMAGHPLAKKEYITKEDLFGEPLITTDRKSIQKELEGWLGQPLSDLDIFATYNIITNVAMMVDSGVASALTIEGAVSLFGGERMVFRPLYPELSMTSVLAWKKYQPDYGAAGRFLEYLKSIQ